MRKKAIIDIKNKKKLKNNEKSLTKNKQSIRISL